jgi:hypothetical protein
VGIPYDKVRLWYFTEIGSIGADDRLWNNNGTKSINMRINPIVTIGIEILLQVDYIVLTAVILVKQEEQRLVKEKSYDKHKWVCNGIINKMYFKSSM